MVMDLKTSLVMDAMRHLTQIKTAINSFNDLTQTDYTKVSQQVLKEQRSYLVKSVKIYQQAAWRLFCGQIVQENDGSYIIYDTITGKEVILNDSQDDNNRQTMLDGIALSPGSSVFMTNQKDPSQNGFNTIGSIETVPSKPKSHANKQTYEQRRANGLKGIEVRKHNQRSRDAKQQELFMLYGWDGKGFKPLKTAKTMNSAFRALTLFLSKEMFKEFVIYDPKGERWAYVRESHSMIKVKD